MFDVEGFCEVPNAMRFWDSNSLTPCHKLMLVAVRCNLSVSFIRLSF
uniref:Uncharacterized protein n=1 Tax=Rhizophora mucronata TaxID=61149 RepID=A0A2P2NU25_RHIMU